MTRPGASLRTDLARIDEALEPFGTPVTDERPGLRWMREVLQQRHEHVLQQLRQAETTRLEVVITSADDTLPPGALATVLNGLQEAVRTSVPTDGEESPSRVVALTVSSLSRHHNDDTTEPGWFLTLERLPGPFGTQAVTAGGGLVADAAVVAAVRAVEDGEGSDTDLSALTGVVRTHALALRLRAVPTEGEPVEAMLDQRAATG